MTYECEKDPGWQYLRLSREQVIKDQSMPYDSKKNCWIPDTEEGFIAADIQSTKGNDVIVLAGGKEMTLKKDLVSEMNPPKFEKTEDMSNLTFLNDASVLHNLRARYKAMLIYTYSGLFCVVINPYKRLPIYTDSVARMYMGKRRNEMPPHLFAVSDEAYRSMLQNHENQSMLITGESGAGKTENTKKVIAYFASVGASQAEASTKGTETVTEGKKKVTLEDQIVQTNPILEAFGNARTVRNNNSSRFGKFIRIHFSKLGKVASCDIEHYLLEKSRVIRQAPGERCYHIFYQIFSDYRPELKKILLLDRPLRDYWFVAQAELTVDGMNDAEEFQLTDEAFDILHFSDEEKLNCYKLMSAHMHIGNMKFKQRPREEQAEPDGTEEAEKAANMYGVDTELLLKSFTHPRVKVGTEWVNKGQNVDQVNWAVGAVGKAIYARVFHWLVKKCNLTLDQKGTPRNYFIGVLDIAGFEIFDLNSFEQLWINFVNEKLQQFFNHHMFILEQEEYTREGIQWTFIDFGLDLQACIELIEKPLGIISMLDEECIVPKASDMTLAQKLNEQHLGKHPNFEKPKPPKGKQAEAHFAMRHYAGVVRYNVTNWLEKNKDPLNDTVAACLKVSKGNTLLNEIWSDYVTQEEASQAMKSGGGAKKKGKSGSFMTVSMLYRESLNKLMTMLYKTHPHFIRCIIPNEKKTSGLLDAGLVLNQLTCNGVLEGIRICRKGFPNRMLHPDFVNRYAILCAVESKSDPDPKECGIKMFERLVSEGKVTEEMYRIGSTKVFFKAGVLAHMEDLRDERLNYIISGFQAVVRHNFALIDIKERREQIEGMKIIQGNIKQWTFSLTWPWFKLYVDVMPIVRESKIGEIIEQLKIDLEAEKAKLAAKIKERTSLDDKLKAAALEVEELRKQISSFASEYLKIEEEMAAMESLNRELEQQLTMIEAKVIEESGKIEKRVEQKKELDREMDELKKITQDIEGNMRKVEAEKKSMDNHMQKLKKEIMEHDESLSKSTRERGKLEEIAKEIGEKIERESGRGQQASRVTLKLKEQLENSQNQLQSEKQNKSETEKAKRKIEGEIRIAHESLDELMNQKHEADINLGKKEKEYFALRVQAENEEITECKLMKQLKEDERRMHELEEAIEGERGARLKIEQYRSEKQREVDELNGKLLEQMEVNSNYTEMSKKHEAELIRLRSELEEVRVHSTSFAESTRKKFIEGIDELHEQIELFRRRKQRTDQECLELQLQTEKMNHLIESEDGKKTTLDNSIAELHISISDVELRCEQLASQIHEVNEVNNRFTIENDIVLAEISGYEAELDRIQKEKNAMVKKIEEYEFMLHDKTTSKQQLNAKVKNLQEELDRIAESLLDENDQKETSFRQIAKLDQEIRQIISKQEDGSRIPIQIFEDEKRKRNAKITELEEKLGASELNLKSLENVRSNLSKEAEDANLNIEQIRNNVANLEKTLLNLEKLHDEHLFQIESMKNAIMSLKNDLQTTKLNQNNENSILDTLKSEVEKLRSDEKIFKDEVNGLTEDLKKENERMDSLEKLRQRYEAEKQELLYESDKAEAALETERSKNARCAREILEFLSDVEKKIREKDEELENVKRASQRTLENKMEENDFEKKEKSEIEKACKKLQNDVNEFVLALDHAKRANNDSQNNIKRYKDQIHEVRLLIDAGLKNQEVLQQQKQKVDSDLLTEELNNGNVTAKLSEVRKDNSQLEMQLDELRSEVNEASRQVSVCLSKKKKLEKEISDLKEELNDTTKQIEMLNESSSSAAVEVFRLKTDLNGEIDRNNSVEREKGKFSLLLKDLQMKIDNVEIFESKKAGKDVKKLKERLKNLESEIEEKRIRQNEVAKNSLSKDRRIYQLEYEFDEMNKNFLRDSELAEKMKNRVRMEQKKLDEMEEVANNTLQKYMGLQKVLEFSLERADEAEMKFRISRAVLSTETNPI